MTNKEAVKILKNEYLCRINIKDGCYPWKCRSCEYSEEKDDVTQAINYAVQALSKRSASSEQAEDVPDIRVGKTDEDTISRQAAIDALDCINGTEEVLRSLPSVQPEIKTDENNHYKTGYDQGFVDACKMYEKKQPERKTGRWIDTVIPTEDGGFPIQVCDQCNAFFPLAYTGGGHNFCPSCGSPMLKEGDTDT